MHQGLRKELLICGLWTASDQGVAIVLLRFHRHLKRNLVGMPARWKAHPWVSRIEKRMSIGPVLEIHKLESLPSEQAVLRAGVAMRIGQERTRRTECARHAYKFRLRLPRKGQREEVTDL